MKPKIDLGLGSDDIVIMFHCVDVGMYKHHRYGVLSAAISQSFTPPSPFRSPIPMARTLPSGE